MSAPETEFPFVLPTGFVDAGGEVHREGRMRLATAADEILPLKDPRVQANPAYLVVILLSRVVVRLGHLQAVNPKVIEGLFASDLAYLQGLYNRVNGGSTSVEVVCPHCEQAFTVEPDRPGELSATPSTSSTRR
ncbi:MAG TPA: phage tail assembly protein [Actinomycetes bacterium]